jgi:hypothetical protein
MNARTMLALCGNFFLVLSACSSDVNLGDGDAGDDGGQAGTGGTGGTSGSGGTGGTAGSGGTAGTSGSGGTAGTAGGCTTSEQCPSGQVCIGNQCVVDNDAGDAGDAGCTTSQQCPSGQVCIGNQCVVDNDAGDAPACAAGWADCDADPVNGCEVNLQTDSSNCSACGNACPGGEECSAGTCAAPETCGFGTSCVGCDPVASGQNRPHGIAMDTGHVYWATEEGSVWRVAKSGGQPTLLGTGPQSPFHMAIDATHVYWTHMQPNGVSRVPIAGGTVEDIDVDFGISFLHPGRFALAVDSTFVWYDATGVVGFTPKAGGSASAYNLGGPITFAGIAYDNTSIFGLDNGASQGRVLKVNKTTGAVETLASGQDMPVTVAHDGGYVYWAGQDDGSIKRIPASGGALSVVAAGQEPRIHSIAVDGTDVFWGSGAGYVKRAPVGGGTPTVLASGKVCPLDVVVDATHVYWTNIHTGEVIRAAK